jgi:hypothetical protein
LAQSYIQKRLWWTQGAFRRLDGGRRPKYCAAAALAEACGNPSYYRPTQHERRLAKLLVAEIPRDKLILRWLRSARSCLIAYNDAVRTTHANIMQMFDSAIARQHQIMAMPTINKPGIRQQ